MELKKENLKNCMYLILFAVLLYVGLQNLNVVLDFDESARSVSAIYRRSRYCVCLECSYEIH